MKRVDVANRQPGDIFLAGVPSLLGDAIWEAERTMHPSAPTDFRVSHAGIVSFNDMVVEAWLDLSGENSVAAINPWSKYKGHEQYLELWRPAAFDADALMAYIKDYGPEKYGWLNLFGFEYVAIMKDLTGRDFTNPVECSRVCSQGVLTELGLYQAPRIMPQEWWAYLAANDDVVMRDCDPLALRMMFLAHQS